jgi:hypothetical protein
MNGLSDKGHFGKSNVKGCEGAAIGAFNDRSNKYLTKVTVGQLQDGVDELYKDYRNRLIPIYAAVWLVCKSSGGFRCRQDD